MQSAQSTADTAEVPKKLVFSGLGSSTGGHVVYSFSVHRAEWLCVFVHYRAAHVLAKNLVYARLSASLNAGGIFWNLSLLRRFLL